METVCASAQFGGYTQNGGFAEYILADPNYIAYIPAGLDPLEAAPIICAGITTYKGIQEADVEPGQWIVISRVGGLGHLAVQYAKAMGLRVCAVDIDDRKLAHASKLGADAVVNAREGDLVQAVRKVTDGGARSISYCALAECFQTRRGHDAKTWHLRLGRLTTRGVSSAIVRGGCQLQNRPLTCAPTTNPVHPQCISAMNGSSRDVELQVLSLDLVALAGYFRPPQNRERQTKSGCDHSQSAQYVPWRRHAVC